MNLSLIEQVQQTLTSAFHPAQLEIDDDSHEHEGHGATGAHLTVRIEAPCFSGQTRIQAHREIYRSLATFMPHQIHALRLEINPGFNSLKRKE